MSNYQTEICILHNRSDLQKAVTGTVSTAEHSVLLRFESHYSVQESFSEVHNIVKAKHVSQDIHTVLEFTKI